jgi:hypothetical protein
MKNDLLQYGAPAFTVSIAGTSKSGKRWANELERAQIIKLDAVNKGYNRLKGKPGGDPSLWAIKLAQARKRKNKVEVIDLTL